MQIAETQVRVGIDIGGTFTDVALESKGTRYTAKLLTTPDNPVDACMEGLGRVVSEAKVSPGDIDVIVHGTTLATNAVIERKGAVTSMVTTEGFRDVIEIGTEGRPEQYDVNILKPEPLVPRRRRFTVSERLNSAGEVLKPLDEAALEALLPSLDEAGTEALAICFLHAYVDSVHEAAARDFFATRRPDWLISCSFDISPEFREFERFSTTCTNAYVQPQVSKYLAEFQERLKAAGYGCEMLMMLSSGGLTTVQTARVFPVRLIESGPAGGAIFACDVARRLSIGQAISFDMGGTTAKICLIDDYKAQSSRRFEVARVYRFRKDSGLPLRIPVIDMVEIGAGGGSIAGVDALGRLTVGPESAGSAPGPACYGLGGSQPTVTDANLALGRIDPVGFAGGSMHLDTGATDAALAQSVAEPMGMSPLAAAYGVTEMVCENMASAARVHAIESGKNVDDRTLIAFGGAAPLHVCQMADKLGIDRIIIPSNAGVGSAVGFLRAPVSYEVVQTHYQQLDHFDVGAANAALNQMERQAEAHVKLGAEDGAKLTLRRVAYMRYHGQGHEISVVLPEGPLGNDAASELQKLFDAEYNIVFGRNIGNIASGEIVSLAVTVTTEPYDDVMASSSGGVDSIARGTRRAFDSASETEMDFTIVPRDTLPSVGPVAGPAVITEKETSIVVSSVFEARVLEGGDIDLRRTAKRALAKEA
ncbi:hydantoinase/oxoprolinase family protein [uncultured Ruegeria sp.]|uniref:hydantoinase/oxoprolinase family protein n=1 Tax=uncultured Ruegeria sp. TaxID=259304 RepID=UPI0026205E6C|nr:hydantoinase/oxoprolinase family protein [uncultured Ruegeria sp.]